MKELETLRKKYESIQSTAPFLSMKLMGNQNVLLRKENQRLNAEIYNQKLLREENDMLKIKYKDLKVKHAQITHYYSVVYYRLKKIQKENDVLITDDKTIHLCPILLVELKNPVKNLNCKHMYSYEGITGYLEGKKENVLCPQFGCNATVKIQ